MNKAVVGGKYDRAKFGPLRSFHGEKTHMFCSYLFICSNPIRLLSSVNRLSKLDETGHLAAVRFRVAPGDNISTTQERAERALSQQSTESLVEEWGRQRHSIHFYSDNILIPLNHQLVSLHSLHLLGNSWTRNSTIRFCHCSKV